MCLPNSNKLDISVIQPQGARALLATAGVDNNNKVHFSLATRLLGLGEIRVKYRPDIDGLRACAVVPVVFYHAGVPDFVGGFVGVDVFFVISGYVITRRILEDINHGQFSIFEFYERRVRRIFPALIATVLFTLIFASFILLPIQMIDLSKSMIASAYFASNIYFWQQSGYFDVASTFRPLLHLWSLAVEEQFYILMPVTMYMTYWLGSRWGISNSPRWRLVFWPALIGSFALSVAVTNSAPSANFFLLPTRSWELLLGALLVLTPLPTLPSRGWAELCSAVGAMLLSYSVFFLNNATPFPGTNALFPVSVQLCLFMQGHRTYHYVIRPFLSSRLCLLA